MLLKMINGMLEEATLDVVRNEIIDGKGCKGFRDFIFDFEQYFKVTNTVTEEAKVTLAMMHLSEDAKLWWRSQYIDIQEGHCTIDT
ncbi:uncharacterized protein E5676_scaffold451G002200 [Cucumis melo var. makuwa]|uniref:Uncharacterized protein n=1 Tax=Cucumis melo var. makuwa TaxID=1194695 RepID=A0A5D3BQG4_CUCMM|nr:uncharacterized protein E5676_scaffold451G002200 [Cucumis melo var. makuwa]